MVSKSDILNAFCRTGKVADALHQPWAEACFRDTWQQFRLCGQLEIVGPSHPDPALLEVGLSTPAAFDTQT